jgi:hypothetical protein
MPRTRESNPRTWAATHHLHHEPRRDDGTAFLRDFGSGPARARDELAESLAEEYIASAISGEEVAFADRDETAAEEVGGPYIEEVVPPEVAALDEIFGIGDYGERARS